MIRQEILRSMVEELQAMRSGHFVPYHKMAITVAILVTVLFSAIFAHSTVFEGKIAVIDLDRTSTSSRLIQELDSSSYITVAKVYTYPQSVVRLCAHDEVYGVLYIPKGLSEQISAQHQRVLLRYYADYLNEAQNAEIIETITEIVNEMGAGIAVSSVSTKAQVTGQEAQALVSPLGVEVRRLFNPTFSASTGTISSFLLFFSSLYLGLTTLMIPGRLRVTQLWDQTLMGRDFWAMVSRIVPYAFFYVCAIGILQTLLVVFGQMRFAGNYLYYAPALFLCAMCIGVLALAMAFNSKEPGAGASLMIFLVPPGFILGGATMATGVLSQGAWTFSHLFPLTWLYHVHRDIAGRGLGLGDLLDLFGALVGYFTFCLVLLSLRYYSALAKSHKTSPEEVRD